MAGAILNNGLLPAATGRRTDSRWPFVNGKSKGQKQALSLGVGEVDRAYLNGKTEGGLRVLSGYFASTTQAQAGSCSGRHCVCFSGRTRSWRSRTCRRQESTTWYDALASLERRAERGATRNGGKVSNRRSVSCRSSKSGQDAPAAPMEESEEGLRKEVTPDSLWQEVRPAIDYLSERQLQTVRDALEVAYRAHDGQKRKSGEPYIIHPVEVARILGELEMDWETVAAGLLHDTVEDTTRVTFDQIEELYGPVVRRIVEGETKVSKLGKMQCHEPDKPVRDVKADDLRQMFLAMTEEVRVIIVKLADRLHNMRTLTHMPPHKQKYIAKETLQVFAPLARLLGMYRIKSELEDLSFMYAQPEEYTEVKRRIDNICKEQEDVVLEAKKVLVEMMNKDKFLDLTTMEAKVLTLCKEPYSIHKKMLESGCCIDEVRDIAQLRIVLKLRPGTSAGELCNVQQVCYHVLGLIHAKWPPVPGTVKDYIATPKPNGYQSLHTTVLPLGARNLFPLEIQIRTEEMDKLAEWGIAAHHSGKEVVAPGDSHQGSREEASNGNGYAGPNGAAAEGMAAPVNGAASSGEASANKKAPGGSNGAWFPCGSGENGANGAATSGRPRPSKGWSSCFNDDDVARRVSWLNAIREWQEEFVGNMSSREFVDTITGELLGSRVFVFTPKGEVKNLPKGATVVDYAYNIHTDVGNKMVAAKVNGNIVSPTHTLANAEVVEILTYDSASTTTKGYQLHQQWLQAAKTRSARHKLTKFLREQAALRSAEITADKIQDFVFDGSELSDVSDISESSDTDSGSDSSDRSKAGTSSDLGQEFGSRRKTDKTLDGPKQALEAEPDLAQKGPTFSWSTGPPRFSNDQGSDSRDEAENMPAAYQLWEALERADMQASEAESEAEDRSRHSSAGVPEEQGELLLGRDGDASKTNLDPNQEAGRNQKKPNGKHNRAVEKVSVGVSWDPGAAGNGAVKQGGGERVGRDVLAERSSRWCERLEDPQVRKAVASFARWQLQMLSMWQQEKRQNNEGKIVQWLSVNCLDRTGLLAEVSGILTRAGVLICTHAGQTDRRIGVGVMLFEVEGFNEEDLTLICQKLEGVEGVLSFSLGCTWQAPSSS